MAVGSCHRGEGEERVRRDLESRDLAGAAYLAADDELPDEYDGPSRAEVLDEEEEMRRFWRMWVQREREGC